MKLGSIPIKIHLPQQLQEKARALINEAILGKPTCNIINDAGEIVSDPSLTEDVEEELCELHHRISMSTTLQVDVSLERSTGKISFSLSEK